MTNRTYRVGDSVYVPGLASNVELTRDNHDGTFVCTRTRDDNGDVRTTVHTVHVTAMHPPKSDLFRLPDTRGDA